MAQEEFVVWRDEQLSRKSGDDRYAVFDKKTRQIVDDCNGHGYKSAQAAYKSWGYKQKLRKGKGCHNEVVKQVHPRSIESFLNFK